MNYQRFISLFFFTMLFLNLSACQTNTQTPSNEHVTEVAVIKIKPEFVSRMPDIVAEAKSIIGTYEGFISWENMRADDTSRVFVDILRWKTKKHADQAFEKFHSTESCSRLMNALEKDVYFGHVRHY